MYPLTSLSATHLDDYLAKGWFRMRQTIFTTHFLSFNHKYYSAIWLRSRLTDNIEDATYRQLEKKNKSFRVEIQPARLTRQQELLYKKYKQSLSFETSDNLRQLLYGHASENAFDSYEVNVYDEAELIGCGYFDLGAKTAAGIVSFYHPDYKKYSLGKYIIYCKMKYCKALGIKYFYPGYVAPGYSFFQYKLTIAQKTVEYYHLASNKWLSYKDHFAATAIDTMRLKLFELHFFLKEKGIDNVVWYYRYYDGSLDPYFADTPLFDYPIFLYYYSASNYGVFNLIVFNVVMDCYEIQECTSLYQMEVYENHPEIFSSELLQLDHVLFSSGQPAEIADIIISKGKK